MRIHTHMPSHKDQFKPLHCSPPPEEIVCRLHGCTHVNEFVRCYELSMTQADSGFSVVPGKKEM